MQSQEFEPAWVRHVWQPFSLLGNVRCWQEADLGVAQQLVQRPLGIDKISYQARRLGMRHKGAEEFLLIALLADETNDVFEKANRLRTHVDNEEDGSTMCVVDLGMSAEILEIGYVRTKTHVPVVWLVSLSFLLQCLQTRMDLAWR